MLFFPLSLSLSLHLHVDTPSITAKLINEQKEDKEKKNYEEKEKVKAENGFQDNYSVVVASGMSFSSVFYKMDFSGVKRNYLPIIDFITSDG